MAPGAKAARHRPNLADGPCIPIMVDWFIACSGFIMQVRNDDYGYFSPFWLKPFQQISLTVIMLLSWPWPGGMRLWQPQRDPA